MPDLKPDQSAPISYPPEAILTIEQVAEWLQMSVSFVEQLEAKGVLRRLATGKARRYSAGMVLAGLEGRLDAYLTRAA